MTTGADLTIPALTVHQPWASCLAAFATIPTAKNAENRCWRTSYRGPLAIHAGQAWDQDAATLPPVREALKAGGWRRLSELPHGAVVAVVDLVDCHRDEGCCQPWGATGQWHWVVADAIRLRTPFPCRGRQKLWNVTIPGHHLPPPSTVEAVSAAIQNYRYHYAHEDGLQAGITEALTAAGLPAVREVRLAPGDRVDVLCGGVGVEVKVAGSAERVLAQLQRYATHDRIAGLVLVTTKATHRALPERVGGKPLTIVYLGGAA